MSGCGCDGTSGGSCGCSTRSESAVGCPLCGATGRKVGSLTLRSQLRPEALARLNASLETFNFCTNPDCPNVYYDESRSATVGKDALKSRVTLKDDDPKTPLCYCKKLLKEDFYAMVREGEPDIAGKIKAIIAGGRSFCEKSNPKGVCCTEDVARFLADHGLAWEQEESGAKECC